MIENLRKLLLMPNKIWQSIYSIATKEYNAKVLLMGMGKRPHKISVFHCASYSLKDSIPYYRECYSNQKTAHIVSKWGGTAKYNI